jgi:uncharacterized membrane protein YphA (DoxX/SURF4 family)
MKFTRNRRRRYARIEQRQDDQLNFSLESIGDNAMNSIEYKETRIKNYALWAVQWLLALLFLWAGGLKLILPLETLKGPVALPGLFVRFIGVAETLGAIGLILPWLLRIRPILTPLAAAGLVVIMIGATVITLAGAGGAFVLFPATVGILAASVAIGRRRAAPYRRIVDSRKADSGPRLLSSES